MIFFITRPTKVDHYYPLSSFLPWKAKQGIIFFHAFWAFLYFPQRLIQPASVVGKKDCSSDFQYSCYSPKMLGLQPKKIIILKLGVHEDFALVKNFAKH